MPFRCLLAVGLLTVAAASGCSGDGDDAVPITAPSTTTATTEAPTTSTTVDFETEVKLAALELLEIRNDVFQHPDESRVSEYIAETCVRWKRERQIVADFVAQGRHWTGPAIVPLGITLTVPDEVNPTLTVAAMQPAGTILGTGGSESVPAASHAPYRVSLVRDDGDSWRINGLSGIELVDDVFATIEQEGLP